MSRKSKNSNVIFIGMPGSGKSTIGKLLAQEVNYHFIDIDEMIQETEHQPLQEILNTKGHKEFLQIEERALLSLQCHNSVIAPGGSAVYSKKAMEHLKRIGCTIFLSIDYTSLNKRITNFNSRGIATKAGQTFFDLYKERNVLYHIYADYCIDCNKLTSNQVVQKILSTIHF